MKNTTLKNINNENITVDIVRYFINNDVEYLIYSLNEIDSAGYIKLYASKIVNNNATIISSDEEWNLIREIIKQIVKNNRDGSPLDIIDINEYNLKNITLVDARLFKLQGNLVTLLSENKNIKPLINEELNETIEDSIEPETIEEDPIDYEQLYNNLLVENNNLKEELNLLKEKIDRINEILN